MLATLWHFVALIHVILRETIVPESELCVLKNLFVRFFKRKALAILLPIGKLEFPFVQTGVWI